MIRRALYVCKNTCAKQYGLAKILQIMFWFIFGPLVPLPIIFPSNAETHATPPHRTQSKITPHDRRTISIKIIPPIDVHTNCIKSMVAMFEKRLEGRKWKISDAPNSRADCARRPLKLPLLEFKRSRGHSRLDP